MNFAIYVNLHEASAIWQTNKIINKSIDNS